MYPAQFHGEKDVKHSVNLVLDDMDDNMHPAQVHGEKDIKHSVNLVHGDKDNS